MESAALLYFSFQPSHMVPVTENIFFRTGDIEHFLVYFVYGMLLYTVIGKYGATRKTVFTSLILGSCFGLINEIMQGFVPTRQLDLIDWLINTIGCTTGSFTISRKLKTPILFGNQGLQDKKF